MNRSLLDLRLTLRSTPVPCLDCSRDLWPWNLRRLKPSIVVLAKLEKRAYRSWKRWLTSWGLKPSNPFCSGFFGWLCNKLRIPDCSPYQVVILTSLGTEDPSTLTSVIWIIQRLYQPNFIMPLLAIWLTFKTISAFRKYLLPTSLVRVNSIVDDRKTDILPKIYVHIWSQNFKILVSCHLFSFISSISSNLHLF